MKISDEKLNQYYRYAISLEGQPQDAFDLVHEALIKVKDKNIHKKDPYIYRTIRNLFLNKSALMDNQSKPITEEISSDINLEKIISDKFDIEKMMKELSPEERELLFLVEVEGFTYKEASVILEINQGTLLSKVHRIKKKLITGSQNNEN